MEWAEFHFMAFLVLCLLFFAARGLSQDQNKNKPYGGSEKQNENYTKSGPPPKIKNVLFHQIQEQKV